DALALLAFDLEVLVGLGVQLDFLLVVDHVAHPCCARWSTRGGVVGMLGVFDGVFGGSLPLIDWLTLRSAPGICPAPPATPSPSSARTSRSSSDSAFSSRSFSLPTIQIDSLRWVDQWRRTLTPTPHTIFTCASCERPWPSGTGGGACPGHARCPDRPR